MFFIERQVLSNKLTSYNDTARLGLAQPGYRRDSLAGVHPDQATIKTGLSGLTGLPGLHAAVLFILLNTDEKFY